MRAADRHPLRFFRRAEAALAFTAVMFLLSPVYGQTADTVSAQPDVQSESGTAAVPQPVLNSGILPARLSDVEGSVRITSAQSTPASAPADTAETTPGHVPPPPPDQLPSAASANMPVPAGSAIQTGDDGRAELQFDDGSIARMAPDSGASVVSLEAHGETLHATGGLTYYETTSQPAGTLAIEIHGETIKPGAGSLIRVDMDKAPYSIAVLHGSAQLEGTSGDSSLQAGQTATLDSDAPDGYKVSTEVASISWDAWNSDRDAELAEMASGETNARDGSSNADAAAWDDLDYYGTWYDVPGVGEAWAPDGVGSNFDPYGSGAWGYYTGIGYVWVSAYPWGWLPYRCGIWGYQNRFGWLWQPGACGTYDGGGWFPYTAVFNPPAGYHLPRYRPIRPFDPRLRTHLGGVPMPPIQAYEKVDRAPHYAFRALGAARPEPRPLPVQNQSTSSSGTVYAAMLPVLPVIPAYRGVYPGSGMGGGMGGGTGSAFVGGAQADRAGNTGVASEHVRSVYIPHTVITPGQEGRSFVDTPRTSVPRAYQPSMTPRPAPAPHYEAPHFSSPAPSFHASSPPASHGH